MICSEVYNLSGKKYVLLNKLQKMGVNNYLPFTNKIEFNFSHCSNLATSGSCTGWFHTFCGALILLKHPDYIRPC
jgi:hypothetical protein